MAASSRLMIAEAERRFPVRIRIAVPDRGLGDRLNRMQAWLDQKARDDEPMPRVAAAHHETP
jgi:hypothetical protein